MEHFMNLVLIKNIYIGIPMAALICYLFTILFSECCREIIRSKRSQGNTVGIIVLDRRRCAHETADQPGDTVLVSCVIDGTFYDPDTDIWIFVPLS